VFVHSKVMIVDDVWAVIGSSNFNRRSMTYDSELSIAVLDEDNQFAKNLRLSLWQEHLELAVPDSINDPVEGFSVWQSRSLNNIGRARTYPSETVRRPRTFSSDRWNTSIDPYGGPRL
jgi:phosphatidylserine/phosphatidylglycerophosphate/cardiolipin synthase-like enzyme